MNEIGYKMSRKQGLGVRVMVFNATFIGGGNKSTQRKPPTCYKSLTNFITLCCIKYTSPETS